MKHRSPANFVDLTGRRFGRLIVKRQSETRGKRWVVIWVCLCDCGTEKSIRSQDLLQGNTSSCGCLRSEMLSAARLKASGHANGHSVWLSYRNRATATRREFTISESEFRRLTSLNCHYCGAPPATVRTRNTLNGDFIFNGLDRVNNAKGYTMENVVPCCPQCNIAKRGLTVEQFVAWIERAYKHQSQRRSDHQWEDYLDALDCEEDP